MTKIEELKNLLPQQRADCLERLFQKNQAFFSGKYPSVGNLLRSTGTAPFHINVTDDFLTITNTETGELCHPEAGLDRFAEALGDWTNNAWIDLIEGRVLRYESDDEQGKYSQNMTRFQQEMLSRFPGLAPRMNDRSINLPTLASGKHFSNPVVFLGVFHGLHVDYFLSRTQLRTVAFVEPDPSRFALSCYFLDYQALDKRFDGLLLHVGKEFPENTKELFFKKADITGAVWTRILPGYPSGEFGTIIDQFRLRWRKPFDIWFPPERQLDGLRNVKGNIAAGQRILAQPVALSPRSRIAVVAAGPSLSSDLDWLRQNQDQFVIFAVHSAVSALQKTGIAPDFQFSLDINRWGKEEFERVQLDPSIPIVTLVNDFPEKFASFAEVLMLPELHGVYPVKFKLAMPFLDFTTGNMALSFACWCRPEHIYLFGLDLGYRQATQTHVAESSAYRDEEEHRAVVFSGHLQVKSNFDETGPVYTQSYFSEARIAAQRPIASVAGQVLVYNCSDGARIAGANPCRTSEIELREYDKTRDVDLIRSMFVPLEEGVHWQALPLDGAVQLEEFRKAALRVVKLKKFNWLKFTKKIDNFEALVAKQLPRNIALNLDRRIVPYMRTVNKLLICWYMFLCFTNSEEEWQQVYDLGYAQLSQLIDEMDWPDGL